MVPAHTAHPQVCSAGQLSGAAAPIVPVGRPVGTLGKAQCMSRFRRDESGANAVEFALVLPILLVLLFGIITGGMLYNQLLTLNQTAREGARFAATLPGADDDECDFDNPDEWCEQVAARIINASGGTLTEANIETVEYDEGADEVTVELRREGRLDIIFASWNPTLSADSVARYEHGGN